MGRANTLQIINSGIIPVLAFFIQSDIIHILSFTGLLWIVTSASALIMILKNIKWDKNILLFSCIKELLSYGIQRVPGDFGMAALISLPAIITAHFAGIKEAGYVAFGTTILNMTGAVFAPFGLVFLPKASQLISGKDIGKLKEYIKKLATLTLLLTFAGLIIFEIFADEIIKIYLGKGFSDLVVIARIIMLGCLAYTFYVSMRSIIDAYYFKAVNTFNIIIALTFFLTSSLIIYLLNWSYIALVSAFVLSLQALGVLTLFDIRKLLKVKS
jgi:O-antigen/teichoic acid export membrane protein